MIEGSVYINGTGSSIAFPSAGLQVVGIRISAGSPQAFTTPIDATRNAVIPSKQSSDTLYPLNFVLKGQTLNYSLVGAPLVTIFYGSGAPFGPSRPLEAYAGSYVTWSPTAAGSTTLTMTFPSAVKLTGIFASTTAGTFQYSFSTKPGYTYSDFAYVDDAGVRTDIVPLADIPAATSVPITASENQAASALIVIYYKQA